MYAVPTMEYMMKKNCLKASKMLQFNLVLGLKIFKHFRYYVALFHLQNKEKDAKSLMAKLKTPQYKLRYINSDTYT